jgi:hypothetical protein
MTASAHDCAAPMNDIPKVVFSKSLREAAWPESSIARDVPVGSDAAPV